MNLYENLYPFFIIIASQMYVKLFTFNRHDDDRLVRKTVKFHEPIKKLRLKTSADMAVQKQLSSGQKTTVRVRAERNLLGQLLVLSVTRDISLEKLLQYELSPIPWALATADGCMCKTNKAQLMHALESDDRESVPDSFVFISLTVTPCCIRR